MPPYHKISLPKVSLTGKYLCLFSMPLVASAVYIGLNVAGLAFPSNILVYIVTSALGTAFFVLSIYKILKKG